MEVSSPLPPPFRAGDPIGIFDSGVGGLTVLRALTQTLPCEDFVYLGDTARLPYGTKSPETVAAYAVQVARRMVETQNIKMLVVACNTASALALPTLAKTFPDLPCLGVIEPSAKAAAHQSASGHIVVLATEGTVKSQAYTAAVTRYRKEALVHALACNLLVGLAEEGWCEGPEAEAVIARYLNSLEAISFDTLILGCTHFPLLTPVFRKLLPASVSILDSATTTAREIAAFVRDHGLEHPQTKDKKTGRRQFLVTDGPARFAALAARFLGTQTESLCDTTSLDLIAL